MRMPSHPVLQYRWAVRDSREGKVLVYYGLRNPPRHHDAILAVTDVLAESLAGLDGTASLDSLPQAVRESVDFLRLIEQQVVVDRTDRRQPSTAVRKQTCTRCVADDHLLPGLEFDEDGVCAFCQCYEQAARTGQDGGPRNMVDDAALLSIAADNKDSRFDVMVLCTGGKDSTYLLWYLAEKLGLRVLAASWNMPYTNDTCRRNIRRSLELLPSVEFVERTLPRSVSRDAMRSQFRNVGLPCLCPAVAHILFFPLAAEERIPVVMQGVEEVQLAVMSYVMRSLQAGNGQTRPAPPSIREQTLQFLEMTAHTPEPANPFSLAAEFIRYQRSIRSILDPIYGPLDRLITRARRDEAAFVPQFLRLKTNSLYGTWRAATELMQKEMDWKMPPGHKGLLHTSCRIEKVKDYCQYMRFRNMRSTFFPQSIVEVSAGVAFGLLSREEGLQEVAELGYHREPEVMSELLGDLGLSDDDRHGHGETVYSLCDCASACRG
ncbi:hypothetical protein G3N56_01975 [Desulfovibrio sulfodismutans]|uniref:Uncharacterized protein n=1 Tax=Desulfolutivibrio sulfodismutans TaxID=63561 RepID=A0A7K3NI68_9BACT|nr:hypothetical protein [Desulfolutivibrio sulfodismutans]NDY55513.1 hypothetical protein [Desulfolutivibrio sulfodismutans]QLA12901.1 hypothetical protein GD606_11765 [Desulfolutivibrio sulfodismutans DSM 3696]